MINAWDFSSLYIPSVSALAAQQAVANGVGLVVIGYDSTQASANVKDAFVKAGALWDAYRLPVAWADVPAQVQNTIDGVLASSMPPGYIWLDLEPTNGVALTIAQIEAAMNTLEAAGITPKGPIKPGIYTGLWVWQDFYGTYTGPADRGYALWGANWSTQGMDIGQFYGGWTQATVAGHQYGGDQATNIGQVDLSYFLDRPAPGPDVADALTDAITLAGLLAQAADLLNNHLIPDLRS